MDKQRLTQNIKRQAIDLGFMYCGVSKAGFLEEEAPRLEQWLNQQKQGKMQWMENHFDKRLNPCLLVEGAKSVISVVLNYFPSQTIEGDQHYQISKYAYGADYHGVLKEKLNSLMDWITEQVGNVQGRAFVDSAPVMDKAWATKSGLGWIGKNANLISPKAGSFFFIGELIVDLELEYDGPIKDYCGTCTRCIDACPTQAITEPYVVDGSKCISYLTIELKEAIPDEFKGKMQDWIFGCDVCQDVCPWNSFSAPHAMQAFELPTAVEDMTKKDWQHITKEVFNERFRHSPIKRAKWEGMMKNIDFVRKAD